MTHCVCKYFFVRLTLGVTERPAGSMDRVGSSDFTDRAAERRSRRVVVDRLPSDAVTHEGIHLRGCCYG
jgi:hypothetical protein